MSGIDISEFSNRIQKLDAFYVRMPNLAGVIAVGFSKDRFREQAWVDARTEPWKKRKDRGRKNQGRAILVKSGRLKRSIRKIRQGKDFVIIGTDVPYAKAHNEGFRGSVSVKRKTGNTFTRHMNLPRRQFIGESIVLARKLERAFTAELIRAIK